MRIIAFQGSPRTEKSSTEVVLKRFLRGAEIAGATSEVVYLHKKKIKPCTGCFSCWTNTPGKCVQKDDMQKLLEKLLAADLVIFATPLYIHIVTACMKAFMERCLPLVQPYEKRCGNTYIHPARYKELEGKKMLIISVCGFPDRNQFTALSDMFKKFAANSHMRIVSEIYRCGAEPLHDNPNHALHRNFLVTVEKAGKEIATSGEISQGTQQKLDKNIPIPKNLFAKIANSWWEKQIKRQ